MSTQRTCDQSGSSRSAMSRATPTTERPVAPSPVRLSTSRETREAAWNRASRPDVVVPSRRAAVSARRTCPWISRSPTTIESSPLATENRWAAASVPVRTRRCVSTCAAV